MNKLSRMTSLLIAILGLSTLSSQAQTTLSAGDIMFIGLNSDAVGTPAANEVAVLFLEPVTTGTVIYFTDFGYTGNSAPYFQQNPNNGCTPGNGAPSDGIVKWTATSNVAAGAQLVIRVDVASSGVPSCNIGSISIVVETNTTNQGMSFTTAGEVVHAFQGTINGSNQVTAATMLGSLHYNNGGWQATLTTCQFSSVDSEDPATGYEVEYGAERDNGTYSGTMSGSKAELQAAILNMSNWTRDNITTYTFPISGSFTVITPSTWNGTTWSPSTPNSITGAIIASSTTPGNFTCKDLTINSGFALTLGSGVTATIYGDMTNSGNGISGVGNLTFSKTGTATLSGTAFSVLGTVIINTGCTLTTADKLTLASDASNTGRIGNSAGSITGNVTIQRYIPGKRAFRFLAHPFTSTQQVSILTDDIDITGSGGATNGFTTTTTNNPSSHIWDVTTADNTTAGNNLGWSAITSATSSSWTKAGLLRVLVRGAKGEGLTGAAYTPSAITLDMTGTVNTGTQTITLTKGASSTFVGCGNPFPCAVQMNTVAAGANVGSSYYVWDATSGTKGAYTTKLFTDNYKLPANAAFFTTVSANTNNTIEFEEADKQTSGDAGIFKTTGASNIIELSIEDSNIRWDVLSFRFNDKAQAVSEYYDAVKLNNPGLDFFTYSSDNKELAIDSRPYVDGAVIPLGLTAYEEKKFVIRAKEFDIPAGTKVYFHDKFLNKSILMDANFEYWFDVTADANAQGKRFELNTVGTPTSIATTNTMANVQLIPNPAHKEVKLVFDKLEGKAQVKVMSITGQVVYTQDVSTTTGSVMIPLQEVPAGVYIVELQSATARFTEKLIKQ